MTTSSLPDTRGGSEPTNRSRHRFRRPWGYSLPSVGECPVSGRAPFSKLLCVRSGSEEGGPVPDVGTGGIRGERMWVSRKPGGRGVLGS